jgi:hypothetical protein
MVPFLPYPSTEPVVVPLPVLSIHCNQWSFPFLPYPSTEPVVVPLPALSIHRTSGRSPSCLIHPPDQWSFLFLPYPSTVTSGRRRRHHRGTGPEVTRCLAAVLPRSHGWKGCAARLLVCYPVVLLLFLPCLRSSP